MGWIGVDLDGTLAEYHGWQGVEHIGEPIPAMVERVRGWLAEGKDVRIMTARVSDRDEKELAIKAIQEWSRRVFGKALKVTHEKDFYMVELWDDRAVQVEHNTGRRIGPEPEGPTTP